MFWKDNGDFMDLLSIVVSWRETGPSPIKNYPIVIFPEPEDCSEADSKNTPNLTF